MDSEKLSALQFSGFKGRKAGSELQKKRMYILLWLVCSLYAVQRNVRDGNPRVVIELLSLNFQTNRKGRSNMPGT